jgi:hypothetical protein
MKSEIRYEGRRIRAIEFVYCLTQATSSSSGCKLQAVTPNLTESPGGGRHKFHMISEPNEVSRVRVGGTYILIQTVPARAKGRVTSRDRACLHDQWLSRTRVMRRMIRTVCAMMRWNKVQTLCSCLLRTRRSKSATQSVNIKRGGLGPASPRTAHSFLSTVNRSPNSAPDFQASQSLLVTREMMIHYE